MSRCLLCYGDDEGIHATCARALYGQEVPPSLDVSLQDIAALAAQALNARRVVTGVQRKLSLGMASDGDRRLTVVGLWGLFILKPPVEEHPEMPELEDLTMHLASATGIDVARHGLIRLTSGELAYITRRFDRADGRRLRVEDMAQLTGKVTEHKYRSSLERVGKTVATHATAAGNELLRLFELVLFCFATGNADMHLKNFSLISNRGVTSLTPAYDLLPTNLLVPLDREESALPMGGRKSKLAWPDFLAFGTHLGLTEKQTSNARRRLLRAQPAWNGLIDSSFASPGMREQFSDLIAARLDRIA